MARDVAQRELDQAGLRIVNLGDPKEAGDATKTDNATVPKANSGAGSPGTSLFAAPIDHVHPASAQASAGSLQFDDDGQQVVTGGTEEVVFEVLANFDAVGAPNMQVILGALVKAAPEGHFRVRIGGTPAKPDGTSVTDFGTTSPTFAQGGSVSPAKTPLGQGLLKITAQSIGTNSTASIRAKAVALIGVPGSV